MRSAHSVAQVRAAEAAALAALPPGSLMQRAAAGLAATCADLLGGVYGSRVVVLVGSGDNGGDALFAGAALARRGAQVVAITTTDRFHEAAMAALLRSGGRRVPSGIARETLAVADLVVDGIVGIGGSGALRAEAAALADAIPDATMVVAVDVPSGVAADTGEVAGPAISADVTVTFGTHKPGLWIDPGAARAGVVRLVDLGLQLPAAPVRSMQWDDVAALLHRDRDADKYSRGVLGLCAGSAQYPGAAVLAARSALATGVGYLRVCAGRGVSGPVRLACPEAVVHGDAPIDCGRVDAWVVGPGIGTDVDAADRLATILAAPVPVLCDADAVTLLAESAQLRDLLTARTAATVLTPHFRELSRLLDVDPERIRVERLQSARAAARLLGAVVLLKGSTTVIAEPDGDAFVNPTGSPALASAGSGDVLTGVIGTLLAGGVPHVSAAAAGAWLHGLAGRTAMASGSSSASALVDGIAVTVAQLRATADPAAAPGAGRMPG